MTILFFSMSIAIMFFTFDTSLEKPRCTSDWWVMPMGIGFVFLFLFVICKKVDKDD